MTYNGHLRVNTTIEQLAQAKALATALNLPGGLSDVVREALHEYLETYVPMLDETQGIVYAHILGDELKGVTDVRKEAEQAAAEEGKAYVGQ